MHRRQFLVAIGAIGLAGCATGSSGDDPTTSATATPTRTGTATITSTATPTATPTATATPEPAEFVVVETTGGTYTTDEQWPLEFTVANRGEQDGEFQTVLQVRSPGSDWRDITDMEIAVPAGEEREISYELDAMDTPGTFDFRLLNSTALWTITIERPSSEFQGSTGEDRTYVDLQYRDYLEHEVEEIKNNAEDLSYEKIFRDAEELRGEPVHFTAFVRQTLVGEEANTYLLQFEGTRRFAYASYVGERFITGDKVECWGQVLGLEIYQTNSRSENTVPALALADMKRRENE